MKTVRLLCKNGDTRALLSRLKNQVFHLTTAKAFTAIRTAGTVHHNRDERFTLNTSSDISFGRLMGYVCLFDLRNHTKEAHQRILDDYYFLGPSWFEMQRGAWMVSDLAYLMLHHDYYDQIIPNNSAHDFMVRTGRYLHFVPNGEVWIDDHLPLAWIDTVILATIRRPISQMERMMLRLDRTYRNRT